MAAFQLNISINRNQVPGTDKTNFPVLFSQIAGGIPANFWTNIIDTTNGLDIRFYNDISKTVEYSREVVYVDTTGQKVEAWIQIPILNGNLNTTDTTFICEVGDSIRSNDTDIWDDLQYDRTFHFQGNANDSTINAQHHTVVGAVPITGKFGTGGYSFDGNSQYITGPRIPISGGGPHWHFIFEGWVKMLSLPSTDPVWGYNLGTIWCQGVWCPGPGTRGWLDFMANILKTGKLGHHCTKTASCSSGSAQQRIESVSDQFTVGTWKHIVLKGDNYNGAATRNVELYVNGYLIAKQNIDYFTINVGGNAGALSVFGATEFGPGNRFRYQNMELDEARIIAHGTGLSDLAYYDNDWITTTFNTQNDPASFMIISPVVGDPIPFNLINRITHAGLLNRPDNSIPPVIVATHGWFDGIAQISTIISDHITRAKNLLIEQFEESTNLLDLVGIYTKQLQQIENALSDVIQSRDVNSATNAQLDIIGERVGESRRSRNDEDYRAAIKLRIYLNSSNGQPEVVREAVKAFTKASKVYLYEIQPARLLMHIVTNYTIPTDLIQQVEPIALSGVALEFTFTNDTDGDFGFEGEGGYSPAEDTLGFGEDGFPTEGGKFIELY